ncbi:MAG: tryptophan synthase subunit alpha [Verrucomicrobiota bacterium]|nr:tryptophan synthase subunit alpha [Verrucomicrobiota bacterium]
MSNRIDLTFEKLRKEHKKGFIAYITAGDPDLESSFQVADVLEKAGVDLLELGIPFSDPLADGIVIQQAAQRALEAGASLPKILDGIRQFRKRSEIPLVLFTYFNPVYKMGLEKLIIEAAAVGVDGILLLDLPPEEADSAAILMKKHGLKQISLIAPTTPEERISLICRNASGFIYYISREGVTGMQQTVASSLTERTELIRSHTALPIAVGFGVSDSKQAAEIAGVSDAVVVGSAIVNEVAKHSKSPDFLTQIEEFVRPLSDAIKSVKG